ncbi:MAG: MFS transporter [Flavobacteriales bacterium]|nr:peptide MFS transporter [Bacteroidales bacterium AH-315-I05]PCJ85166.1 MAG: MFS transporter [Flavobacteriales bacterium]
MDSQTGILDSDNIQGENRQDIILGHPAGLFLLFFTEMWERFSYYGMRALLVLFLISDGLTGGWAWERDEALMLYGIYTGLVYLTPIFGGLLADKILGYRKAVMLGALLMTLGHASMALETEFFFFAGLVLLILGNGAFKPNISSIVGGIYPKDSDKKDAAYTIFYMGINAGAFLGILLCGYIGEKVGWSYGFGLAGVFMFLGMLMFKFGQGIFGEVGLKPIKENKEVLKKSEEEHETPKHIVNDRLLVIGILAFFTIFFWMAFEQAGGSMTIFAKDYTNRVLEGDSANIFKYVNTALTIIPLGIVTWVLWLLSKKITRKYPLSTLFISLSFVIIWGIALWMLNKEFNADVAEVPASWFGILNSFFIIAFAPLFSKLWETKYNPSGPIKFSFGLILLGLGFAILAYGGRNIPNGAEVASVSMVWLILAYLLHTLGELCLSPVGLSYVSKLAAAKVVGLMFGVWFVANFVANTLAGLTGSFIDKISETYSISVFFLIFTFVPIIAGVILIFITPFLKKKMHGIH